jgi:hypothetical protein
MNERIKAIWNRAASSHVQADTSWQTQQNFLYRFAELIVDECAYIAEQKEQGNPSYDPNISSGWYIKKHMGIIK